MRAILKSIFKNKTLLFTITVLMFSFLLSGCKNGGDTNQVDNTPKEYEAVEKTIGVNGGEVKDEKSGLGLTIPSGALEKDTNISVQYVENKEHVSTDLLTSFLGAAEFKPSGTVFSEPVEVSMNLTEAPLNSTVCVFCYDEENNVWDFITDANCNGKIATFNITHFSKYQCLNITEAMYSKYIDLVNQAQRDGKSDSWITESYRDYLVNEKHVMDYYEEFGGYYYEPVGLFIGGAYQLNGKQGDGDELTKRYGESNKVGNTYGYSKVGGKTVSYAEAKSELGKTKEKKDVIDVTVTIDYKMIKPTIDLTATKTTLKKGETATVNVYCHYAKPGNTIYPDFALPNYRLTIQKPSHLTIDNTEVTTNNSGKAMFTVQSKDGEKDTVKITFDVAGDFGTHAEGFISFCENDAFSISGKVIQEFNVANYIVPLDTEGTVIKEGSGILVFTYFFTGNITKKDGNKVEGTIKITDATAIIKASNPYELFYDFGNGYSGTIEYNLFNSIEEIDFDSKNIKFTGTISNDGNCSININSWDSGVYVAIQEKETFDGGENPITANNQLNIVFKTNSFLEFDLEKGIQTKSYSSLKDSFKWDWHFFYEEEFTLDYTGNTRLEITLNEE